MKESGECDVVDLRSGRLTIEETAILETIIYQLTGKEVPAAHIEYTRKSMEHLENEQGPGSIQSTSYVFPTMRWKKSQSEQLIVIDLGPQRAFYCTEWQR